MSNKKNKKEELEIEQQPNDENDSLKFVNILLNNSGIKDINDSELGVFKKEVVDNRRFEDENENKKDPKIKIDFEKFTKTKSKNKPTTDFGMKFDKMLRTPQWLKIIWITILSSYALIFAISIGYIISLNTAAKITPSPSDFGWIKGMSASSIVFSYIALIAPLAPLLFLITSWFIGINGVHSSRMFHYFLWVIMSVAGTFAIIVAVFGSIVLANVYSFHSFQPDPPQESLFLLTLVNLLQ